MMWLILILVVVVAVAAYPLLKLVRLLRGDADLVVLSKKMKPEYFKGKVIWVTGASSGSKYKRFTYHSCTGKDELLKVEVKCLLTSDKP